MIPSGEKQCRNTNSSYSIPPNLIWCVTVGNPFLQPRTPTRYYVSLISRHFLFSWFILQIVFIARGVPAFVEIQCRCGDKQKSGNRQTLQRTKRGSKEEIEAEKLAPCLGPYSSSPSGQAQLMLKLWQKSIWTNSPYFPLSLFTLFS